MADESGALARGKPGRSLVMVRDFVPDRGVCRAKRATTIAAVLENTGDSAVTVTPRLPAPAGVRIVRCDARAGIRLDGAQRRRLSWVIEARDPRQYTFKLQVLSGGSIVGSATLDLRFLPPMPVRKLPYIPDPEPVRTPILIGAHNCPLWEAGKPTLWAQVRKHPERTPALGFYSQENPEVADWETKWAVEHGVSFFVYCWYRASQGGPVKMNLSSSIHDALLKSRFVDHMKFTIMWENQWRGMAGVSDEKDLMTNLLPFWIDNYFKHPSYLKIDNKPALFIYRPEFLIEDLGGVDKVAAAFDKMRQACVNAGFAGLYILGEYRGLDPNHLRLMKQLGLDYTFAYCWGIADDPTPEQAVETQMRYIRETQALNIIPQVVTVSQAWSGWEDEGSIWKIPPAQFGGLLRQAKDFVAKLPAGELGSRMLLLDNWNEWSEGHYIAPYREYGFGYLDVARKVFSDAPAKHVDLVPEDIGMGPYDKAYTAFMQTQERLRGLAVRKVRKKGADEPGLVGWWAFDEAADSPVALDYSGHRLGGSLNEAARAKGVDGNALDCRGGCVVVPDHRLLSPANGMTIECWARTDLANQNDKWFVNRICAPKTNTGYQLGLIDGRPCFGVPQTEFSHRLTASDTLPLGRWVHVAGTFDGQTMRLYMDGRECGSMERPGPVNPNDFPLCLGSYARNHPAHFTGLLDEVKLYSRALSADELRARSVDSRQSTVDSCRLTVVWDWDPNTLNSQLSTLNAKRSVTPSPARRRQAAASLHQCRPRTPPSPVRPRLRRSSSALSLCQTACASPSGPP